MLRTKGIPCALPIHDAVETAVTSGGGGGGGGGGDGTGPCGVREEEEEEEEEEDREGKEEDDDVAERAREINDIMDALGHDLE